MTKERENTIELRYDCYLSDYDMEEIQIAANNLASSSVGGIVIVTIEFRPENEVEDEE